MRRMSTMIAGLLLAVMSLPAPCAAPTSIDARPFPRQYSASGTPFTVYQPQMESWEGNRLRGRFAVSVKTGVENGADGKTVRARLNSVAVTPLEPLLFNSEQSTVDRITAIQRIRPQGAP